MQMKLKLKTMLWNFLTHHTTPIWINVIRGNEWVPLKYYNICSESMN